VFAAALVALAWLALPAWSAEESAALRERHALALNDVTGDQTITGEVKILLDDRAEAKKLLAAAMAIARVEGQPFNYNAASILARVAQDLKDLEAGQAFYRICIDKAAKLKSANKLALSYAGIVDLLYENKKYDEALRVCREILELKGDEDLLRRDGRMRRLKDIVLDTMIQALGKQGKTDEALKLVNNQLKVRPDDWRVLEIKAVVLHDAGRNTQAAKTYEQVLDRIGKDDSLEQEEKSGLQGACRYILSGLYAEMDQVDKAAEQLKTLLDQKPNNPTYNNDLGYIWADHDIHLDEAEKMIRKAIDEERKERKRNPDLKPTDDRDNAAFLDSLGWVLFKQKKLPEAKKYLEDAVKDKDEGQHTEIYDHLGDVNMALGDKAQAVSAWKKALDLARKSKRDQERKLKIEKKIKEAK
jgi:pentatricopeptide repeat protein